MSYYYNGDYCEFSTLKNKVLTKVDVLDDEIHFYTTSGEHYLLYHCQDCCENVYVESVIGDINDLIGNPILLAEVSSSGENPPDIVVEYPDESYTWTFYKLATIKGYVDIRWYGSSNGYYSESVDFVKIEG